MLVGRFFYPPFFEDRQQKVDGGGGRFGRDKITEAPHMNGSNTMPSEQS